MDDLVSGTPTPGVVHKSVRTVPRDYVLLQPLGDLIDLYKRSWCTRFQKRKRTNTYEWGRLLHPPECLFRYSSLGYEQSTPTPRNQTDLSSLSPGPGELGGGGPCLFPEVVTRSITKSGRETCLTGRSE